MQSNLTTFDALPFGKGVVLGDRHTITIAPSTTVLHLIRSRAPRVVRPARLLAVGNVNDPGAAAVRASRPRATRGLFDPLGSRNTLLPSTGEEVADVAAQAGSRSVVLAGGSATETAFK